jgi:hypothetical protein
MHDIFMSAYSDEPSREIFSFMCLGRQFYLNFDKVKFHSGKKMMNDDCFLCLIYCQYQSIHMIHFLWGVSVGNQMCI